MRAEDLANRLLGLKNPDLVTGTDSSAPLAGAASEDAPSYVYGASVSGIFSIYFFVQPGDPGTGGVWLAQVGLNFGGGVGFFNTNVSFQDSGGVQRAGWIYQFAFGGNDFAFYFPDYIDAETGEYLCGEVTLPYTPGQPPAGLDNPIPLQRSPS
jgi:hypothetical protein